MSQYRQQRVTRLLEQIAARRGYPARIRCDNGPEFIEYLLEEWAGRRAAVIDIIEPGKLAQNACIESFNRNCRVEVLGPVLIQQPERGEISLQHGSKVTIMIGPMRR